MTKNFGFETNRLNQIEVKNTLQTTVDENVYVIGDCKYIVARKTVNRYCHAHNRHIKWRPCVAKIL